MKDKVRKIKDHIQKVYLTYGRPMVIGFSGGKDSTVTLQVVWDAIAELPPEKLANNIHVITTDTLVETPYIERYIVKTIDAINKAAQEQKLPISAHKLTPLIEDSFWVNLLGKGYPAPSQQFRWCTERLKIDPVSRFVREHVDKFGEATIVLGARLNESSSRDQVLKKQKRDKLGLSKHSTLPAAYIFTPIEQFTTDEIWTYLLSNQKTPWGSNNRDLAAMYQNASSGECPMVIDVSTPACGNSRFGCWVCTLVVSDTSMENLIDSGEEWLTPLLEYRDFLSETQKPINKPKYRNYKRRNGRASLIRDGSRLSYGPYKPEWKKELLRRLLEVECTINEEGPSNQQKLISFEELEIIRTYWKKEDNDWEDSVPKIFSEIYGDAYDYNWVQEDSTTLNISDYHLLADICKEDSVPVSLIASLIDMERDLQGMSKRSGVINRINKIFSEEWRTEEEIIKSIGSRNDN